ncbi:MAG: phosphate ABC transporter substrate-binding protein [candidate division Zixibacteria bacterium]|nr:phosphate ABC transporter substrate-binding protein [candidate division Zixibacteria bacterium]
MKSVIRIRALIAAAAFLTVTVGGLINLSCSAERPKPITIKGSDTMVQLVSSWAEAYMKKHPGSDISVTGGGSGTGIAALINGTTDICSASREMKEKEITQAAEKGITAVENTVASDGIAVIVNPANPINELTQEQIAKIYTGAYTNWKQLGGPDQPIMVLSRESNSGTYVFFQEHVLKMKDYAAHTRLMPATSAIVQSVGADIWAIGYVGLGYAVESEGKVKMLAVKADDTSPAVIPSEQTVLSGQYSIARGLYLYTNGTPEGQVKNFVDFCLSPEGQKIAVETGYVPVK